MCFSRYKPQRDSYAGGYKCVVYKGKKLVIKTFINYEPMKKITEQMGRQKMIWEL